MVTFTTSAMTPPAASTRLRILPKITFACSYSSRPSMVLPSPARETMPEMKSMSPTRKALDHRPGGGSATWGLVTLSIFMHLSSLRIFDYASRKVRSHVACCKRRVATRQYSCLRDLEHGRLVGDSVLTQSFDTLRWT